MGQAQKPADQGHVDVVPFPLGGGLAAGNTYRTIEDAVPRRAVARESQRIRERDARVDQHRWVRRPPYRAIPRCLQELQCPAGVAGAAQSLCHRKPQTRMMSAFIGISTIGAR